MNTDIKIGNRIKARRIELGMSQEELATKTGYDSINKKSAISKIENNKNDLTRTKITVFAKALNTTEAYLMGWIDNPELTHEQTLELERQGKLNTPHIIAASTITTDGTPIPVLSKPENIIRNPKKDILIKLIQESDIPDSTLDLMTLTLQQYKK